MGYPKGMVQGSDAAANAEPRYCCAHFGSPMAKKTAKHLTSASTAEAWFRMQLLMEILRETKATSGTHVSIRFKVLGIAGS